MLNFLDILKAQSGIPVEDPYAMLWGKALSSPGHTIKTLTGVPTSKGGNTLTVNTTVQPSEMSITYKGK